MKIGILSDTHGYLDDKIFDYFKDCDEIWHAGDIGDIAVTDKIKAFKKLRAVHGNALCGLRRRADCLAAVTGN